MKTHTSSLTILKIKKIIKSYLVTLRQENVLEKKKTTYQHTATCQIYSLGPFIKRKKICLISLTAGARIQFHFPTRNITVFTGITLLSHTSKV